MLVTKNKKRNTIKVYTKKGTNEFDKCASLYKKSDSSIYEILKEKIYFEYPFRYFSKIIKKFPDSKFSRNFIEHIDVWVSEYWKKKIKKDKSKIKLSRKLKPRLFNIKLRDFQKTGIIFAADRLQNYGGSAIIADDMGLGKTIQAISTMLYLRAEKKVKKTLIVCPPPAKEVWMRMLNEYTKEQYIVLENRSCLYSRVDIVVVTYDQFRILKDWIYEKEFDLIIVDEFHKIKNPYAQRTEAVKGLDPTYKLFLSGTPILNRVDELWSTLNFINPKKYAERDKFVDEYCITKLVKVKWKRGRMWFEKYVPKIVGAKRTVKLRNELRTIMIRRRKKDVLKELPDKIYQNLYVNLKTKQRKVYDKLTKELVAEIDNQKISVKNAMAKFTKLRQICESLGTLGEKDVSAKLDMMEEIVGDLVSQGHKVFVVSYFNDVAKFMKERLKKYKPAYVTGGTNDKKMVAEIKRFNKDKKCKIYVGTITKNMEAIDLTAASHVIFVGKHLVQKLNEQLEDRIHRMNQAKKVHVISIICRNTVEDKIEDMLLAKKELFNLVIEGKVKKTLSIGQIRTLITKKG